MILDPLNDPAGVPTNEEIVRENRILLLAQHHQQFGGGNLTNDEYGNAIVRHCRILSTRAEHDRGVGNAVGNAAGNAALATQIADVAAQLNERFDEVNVRLDGIDRRLNLMDIIRLVDRARSSNNRITHEMNSQFINIVKHIRGHPNNIHLNVNNVIFEAEYNVGAQPPNNLIPSTHVQFNELANTPHTPTLRRNLRAIYWFYNDPTLQLAGNATRLNCLNVLQRLRTFITEP